jgi:hypothetical protein
MTEGHIMPINRTGQGYSPNTPVKQKALEYFLHVHANIVRGAQGAWRGRADPHYYYIETNAGCGTNDDGTPGSVLLAQQIVTSTGLAMQGIAIEKRAQAVFLLEQALRHVSTFRVIHGDNARVVTPALLPATVPGAKLGLMYCDPNDVNGFPFEAVVRFFREDEPTTQRLDLLVNLAANQLKRCQGAGHERHTLRGIMAQVHKEHWFIRQPYWHDQWIFLFGTNCKKWPTLQLRVDGVALRDYRSLGLYPVESVRGQEILANLVEPQAAARQRVAQRQLGLFQGVAS